MRAAAVGLGAVGLVLGVFETRWVYTCALGVPCHYDVGVRVLSLAPLAQGHGDRHIIVNAGSSGRAGGGGVGIGCG